MIDFTLTDGYRQVSEVVQEFGKKHVLPDLKQRDQEKRHDPALLTEMAGLDLLGICIPARYGGAGMDYISLGIACEELEYFDTSLREVMSVHVGLNSLAILTWGSEEQKQRFLVPQAKGDKIAGFGLTEPGAGSDVVGIQSTARKDGDSYILNGEKMWISLADVADNFLMFAWTDQDKKKARDHHGISAFIVERGMPGFSSGTLHDKWGIRAANTGYFAMQDLRLPKENLVGYEGEGFKIAMFCLEQGRYTSAAGATGLIRACLDASVKYAHERKTFEHEIGEHQLVKEMIAGMTRDYEASRLLYLRAGWLKNQGQPNMRETALAKWFATVASERCASDAVQVHGAYGYSDDYPVGRFYRNAKGAVIYEGTREIMTLLQGDYALGYRKDKPRRCELPKWEEK
jgi:glutaryl-CoA dehydrogenase (non-decarboxylating)